MSLAIRCLAISLLCAACGSDLAPLSQPAAIVGSNEQVSVDDPSQLPASIAAQLAGIGRLDGLCTAFHLGGGLVGTAAHCFAETVTTASPCVANDIEWSDGSRSQCIQILYKAYNDDEDIVIFEVDPAPAAQFSIESGATLMQSDHRQLLLLGYPHERDLALSADCSMQSTESGQLRFEHDCDSLPGNSGSPIFDQRTGEIIGIHNGSSDNFNYATSLQHWGAVSDQVRRIQRARLFSGVNANMFGPFEHNQRLLLRHLPSTEGDYVRFDLKLQIEDGYDFVVVRDGLGIRRTLTGDQQTSLDLKTPVVIAFESDYAGASESVAFDAVFFHQ